jgi:hypothetical protein
VMNRRRTMIGLCMLCALAFSAFAAQSAAAATKGTTAFTCKETGPGGGFTKAHCKSGDAGSGNFSHVTIPPNTKTEVIASNEATGGELVPSQLMMGFGDTVTGRAAKVSGSGWLENSLDAGGEHYLHGEIALTYSEVTETELECEVAEDGEKGEKGVVRTTNLEFTTKGQGDHVKILPKEGTTFASANVSKCVFEGTLKWVGSVKCAIDGSTVLCNKDEITAEKTMRVGSATGPAAGIFGSITLKGRTNSADSYKPISPTTVETP